MGKSTSKRGGYPKSILMRITVHEEEALVKGAYELYYYKIEDSTQVETS